jgi:hypothetical protein
MPPVTLTDVSLAFHAHTAITYGGVLGAGRLVWGSDMPNVERFCTYRQSFDYVRKYCPFLAAREKVLIPGGTCAAFYGIGKRGASNEG